MDQKDNDKFQVIKNTLNRDIKLLPSVKKEALPVVEKINKKLSPKQWKFVTELVYGEADNISGTEAARRAGISDKKARTRACLWQNPKLFPQIVRAIRDQREEVKKQYDANKHTHMMKLAKLREGAEKEGQFSAAINAEIHRGKTAGLYIERKAVLHGSIDNMSREDVLKSIKEIKTRYMPLLSNKAKKELFGKNED